MKYEDLSLKAKFDAAVMRVFSVPSRILSDEYEKDGQHAFLEFKKNKDYAGYCGSLVFERVGGTFLGFGKLNRDEVLEYGPQIVGIDAIEEIIESWQADMREAGWTRRELVRVGRGTEYQAVAYKNGVNL
tara:strand:+ start:298 stop:687 length:390 start_codon:yes stop_codon:yes gene_type:complete